MHQAVLEYCCHQVGDDTAAHGEVLTVSQEPSIPSSTPPTPPPQPPQDLPLTSQEALDACAALTRRVKHLEYDKVAQALEIIKLKRMVKKLEKGNRVKVLKLRRLKRVGTSQRVDTSEDIVMDDASNQVRIIDELDKDDAVALMDDKEEDKKEEEAKVVKDDQVQGRKAESQAEIYKIDLDHASKVLSMQEDEPAEVHEVVDVVTTTKLITEVVTAASETVTAASIIVSAAEPQVPAATITAAPDKGKGIMVEESKPLKKKQHIEMDEEYARKLHAELKKDIDWDAAIDHKEDTTLKVYTRSNAKCSETSSGRRKLNVLGAVKVHKTTTSRRPARMMVEYILHQAQEQDFDQAKLSAAKQKLMLLDSAAEGRLMLLSQFNAANNILMLSSQVNTANDKCCC
nr:hypothetical protein [Tanacetum cinerariifolium]